MLRGSEDIIRTNIPWGFEPCMWSQQSKTATQHSGSWRSTAIPKCSCKRFTNSRCIEETVILFRIWPRTVTLTLKIGSQPFRMTRGSLWCTSIPRLVAYYSLVVRKVSCGQWCDRLTDGHTDNLTSNISAALTLMLRGKYRNNTNTLESSCGFLFLCLAFCHKRRRVRIYTYKASSAAFVKKSSSATAFGCTCSITFSVQACWESWNAWVSE